MVVQAPVLLDNLGYPVIASSLDRMDVAATSEFVLPDPFANLGQPVQIQRNSLEGTVACFAASTSCPSGAFNHLHPLHFSDAVADELQRQSHEIELFLQLQNDSLRHTIEEQNKQHITALLSSIEHKIMARVRKTEQDLAQVTRRTRELEDCLKNAEMETQAWQRAARENEAMVVGLNNMLSQAHERLYWAGPAQDVESVCECCGGGGGCTAEEEEEEEEEDNGEVGKIGCKWCESQRSCMVFLPCKHLCACRRCERLLGMCPVCKSVKEGSIEVFLN